MKETQTPAEVTARILQDFPEFDNAESVATLFAALSKFGLVEDSFRNDALPSLLWTHPDCDVAIKIWLNYLNPDLSECPSDSPFTIETYGAEDMELRETWPSNYGAPDVYTAAHVFRMTLLNLGYLLANNDPEMSAYSTLIESGFQPDWFPGGTSAWWKPLNTDVSIYVHQAGMWSLDAIRATGSGDNLDEKITIVATSDREGDFFKGYAIKCEGILPLVREAITTGKAHIAAQ